MSGVRPLSGLDAVFLYAETPNAPMNVIATVVVDGRIDFDAIVARVQERRSALPPFRRRLVDVPFGFDHPGWIEDPDFDVREHVARVVAPLPGDDRSLQEVVARIARCRLDRAKPLWELVVVEGLSQDRTALVVKAHHAAVDGVSGTALLLHLFDRPGDEVCPPPSARDGGSPGPEPTARELLRHGLVRLRDRPRAWRRAAGCARRAGTDIARARFSQDTFTRAAAKPFRAPESPFNGALSPRRSIAYARSSLQAVRGVRAAFGGTVNDVVLTACTRALQGELRERGAAADLPLVAAVPVSTRGPADAADCGNRISAFLTQLPVQLEDPLHQLSEVARATRLAKRFHAALGEHTLASLAALPTPRLLESACQLYGRWKLASLHRPLANLVISNVPGPPVPLGLFGQRVRALHPHGPLMEGVGLNITVLSYAGSIDIGVLACRERVPAAWRLADRVAESLEELAKLAEAEAPEAPPLALEVA